MAIQKITLSASRDIPFNKLALSQANVRRVKSGVAIEDLAEDIARRGLLQSLNVRPTLDVEGQETGIYEVPAGGRRFRALELLVKQKRLAKTAPVPCTVREAESEIPAEEDSLAENVQREPLHPLDQFRAFKALRDKGFGEEHIAARFFTTAAVVKQRLKLTAVAEKLLDIYAEDGMTLEQLMAFTVTDDHARQEQVWEALQHSYSKEPFLIRRRLTEDKVRASDRRALFVGVEAYEAAGGSVMRDLFQADDGGWVEDAALLDRLAAEKLAKQAETVATEGWKWVQLSTTGFPYGHAFGLRKLEEQPADLTEEEQAAFAALKAEYETLETEYADADELPEEVDAKLGAIETALAAYADRPAVYDSAEIGRAGAFVGIGPDGKLSVDRGYVRPEDEALFPAEVETAVEAGQEAGDDPESPRPAAVQRAVITIGGQAAPEEDEDDAIRPLPDRLLSELTAHRTLALRDAVATNPHVAMTALLYKLCLDLFRPGGTSGSFLEASVRQVYFPIQATDLKDSPSAKAVAERHAAWDADLPRDEPALWNWLAALDETSRAALLAHCVSLGVNALYEKANPYGGAGLSVDGVKRRLVQADRLAQAVGLDMVEAGWRPTVDNYLGRVSKVRILEAVREAKGERDAQLIDHLKKADMALEAERLLEGAGWLPEPLRLAGAQPAPATEDEPAEALPAFLAGDGGEVSIEEAGEVQTEALAAE
jgi:ParB family chromosome partitioning protein